jgi:hypothetical protein
MKKLITAEFYVLLVGMLFAWTNFTLELIAWLKNVTCPTGCVPGIVNPFYTPCFYGACCFTIAFILSAVLFAKSRKQVKTI